MKPRLCPNAGATMQADVAKGVWRCRIEGCYEAMASGMPLQALCPAGLETEYQEPMSPAELMAATGAKGLFDVHN